MSKILRNTLKEIKLYTDKRILNPLLNPLEKAGIRVVGINEDGSETHLDGKNIIFSCSTKYSSGNAEVISIDSSGLINPLAGGVGVIEACVDVDGKRLTANLEFIVRPFFREYHQTLTMKMYLGMDGQIINGKDYTVVQTFERALETIKKIDCITRGIPKIIYLVGWQKGGHDHLYPSWFEVNQRLKREQDETALQSLNWLMEEAEKYHTSVSLHINMNDVYEDSPMFHTYFENDLLARNADGSLLSFTYEGRQMYSVSPTREWESGFAKKRIDALIEMLPKLVNFHTIHIDNWVVSSHHDRGPLSPYHGISIEEDEEAQREMFIYWRSKGFDVTSEGVYHGRLDPKIGLQPMAWWDVSFNPLEIPACLYCGGRTDRLGGDPRFGDSMHGEDIMLRNHGKADILEGFMDEFCTNTLIWYYLNRLERKSIDNEVVAYSKGVEASCKNGKVFINQAETVLRRGDILFVPVLWQNQREIIAYSRRNTYIKNKLPDDWKDVKSVEIYEITYDGLKSMNRRLKVIDGFVEISIEGYQAVSIFPCG